MRICLLTRGDLFPDNHGAAVKIVRTAQHLARAGHPTFIVTDDRDGYLAFDGDGAHRHVPFTPRFRAAQEWPLVRHGGRWAEAALLRLGVPADELFLYRPQLDPAWWARAVQVGLIEGIDVFQAEFPGYGVPAWLASRALRRPGLRARAARALPERPQSAVVQHNVEWERLQSFGHDVRWLRPIEQAVLAAQDHVVAVSTDDRARMEAAGLPPGRTTVIPHGVDVAAFSAGRARAPQVRTAHDIPADAPLLVFHGTLHYWPNTQAVRFIAEELLPRLLPHHPELRVLICGLGPPRYYSHPAIVFTGPVHDLPAHVAAADVAICPLTHGGGTRLKLLEYMAAGLPIVSTTKGAEGLQITNGVHMRIADGADAFAQSVSELLTAPGGLGAQAAAFARAYDWSAVAGAYVDLYQGRHAGSDANARLRSTVVAPIDAHLDPGRTPSKPLTMLLLVNRGCNLRCVFCDLWQDYAHMDVETQVLPLLDDAAAIGTRTLVLTGGEPLLHPGIFDIITAARDRGMGVNLTTNGTLVDKHWDALVNSGLSSVSMSLDGLGPTHDALRGQRGAFTKTMRALERVLDDGRMGASVYFTTTRTNVHELVPLFDQVHAMGAGFDFWPVNDAPDMYLRTDAERAAWTAAVDHIGAVLPDVAARAAYYEQGLAYHAGKGGPVRCLGLVDQYGVTYKGELLPCCVWGGDGLAVGNVFQTPLRELWRAPQVQAARHTLHAQGCSVGCFNHSLYEFEASTGQSFRV